MAGLPERPCVTKTLRIRGFHEEPERLGRLAPYGSDATEIEKLIRKEPRLAEPLCKELPDVGAGVVWAVREEMARTLEDALARRLRALFLDARAAMAMAPAVAELMGRELSWDPARRQREV